MNTFEDKFYELIKEAGDYIIDKVVPAGTIDIYSTENTIYEKILSDKYECTYTTYELVKVYEEEGAIFIKGVDTVNEEEYDFYLKDLSPEVIIEIADKLSE